MEEFEAAYKKHFGEVFRYALRCTGRREIAEEVASEAFLSLYRNRDHVDFSQLPGWLLTVVRNRATDYWRKHRAETQWDEQPIADPGAVLPEIGKSVLEDARLKPVHRTCLILRYVHEMDREQIARRTGLSANQVKSALQYGLTLLRQSLGVELKP
ncbi:MAG: sigma-70 family RNA polymerase sigma factor [Acidobacteria bacterium]|nr:sigma-70 family RNA polymerase sigma factor [Acidobacteriota bacterium]